MIQMSFFCRLNLDEKMLNLDIAFTFLRLYNVFRIIICEHRFARLERSLYQMKENKLLSYISTLTPEQIEKLVKELPRLTSLLSEQAPLCPPEQTSQSQ